MTGITSKVGAQAIPLPLEREFIMNALRVLEDYEFNSTLRNTQSVGEYMALFADENQVLFNDLLGISEAETLPLRDYVELFRKNAISPSIKIKNVRRGKIQDTGEALVVPLYFKKEMRYNNKCGAILSSNAYYNDDYDMEMVVSMDKASKEIQIISLTGKIDSEMPRLGQDFAIVEYHDSRDKKVSNNGQLLNFNVFDQAFIPMPYNLNYSDEDENMKIHLAENDCNNIRLSYHPRHFVIKPYANIPLGSPFSMGEASSMMDISTSGMEFGIDFGYILTITPNFKINLFTGLGYSTGKINMTVGDLNYHYSATSDADIDGVPYTRYYEISDLQQSINLGHIILPLYGDFEYKFGKIFSAFAQLGVKMYFNAGSKVNSFTGNMYVFGVYPEYGNLLINAPYMNDFGHTSIDENADNDLKVRGASFDGIGGLGVRAKIYGPLSIEAGVNYQIGLSNIMINARTPGNLVQGAITESQAFATYTVKEGTILHSLTDYIGNIKRSSLNIKVGLILKF